MKKSIKLLIMLSFVLTLLSALCISSSATSIYDISGHWGQNYIYFSVNKTMIKTKTVSGHNYFYPDNPLKRKEAAYAFMRLYGANVPDSVSSPYYDVTSGQEYCGGIYWAYQNSVMVGTSGGYFKPENNISRQDMCVAMYAYFNHFGITIPESNPSASYSDFSDGNEVSNYAKTAVNKMLRIGLISGQSSTILAPKANMTHTEAAVIFTNAYSMIQCGTGTNSIIVYATDNYHNELSKATVYTYRPKDSSSMYPESPVYTTSGVAKKTGLNSSKQYGVNVMKENGYTLTPTTSTVSPSNKFVFVTVYEKAGNDLDYNYPISSYDPEIEWPHNSSAVHSSSSLCTSNYCPGLSGKCPHSYMNVFTQENFGWRYGGLYSSNALTFHCGVDISKKSNGSAVTTSTSVKSAFSNQSVVTKSSTDYYYGEYVQLHWGDEYVTYMHLNDRSVSANTNCSGGSTIGHAGMTGATSRVHVHIQFANINKVEPSSSSDYKWYLDPFRFMQS